MADAASADCAGNDPLPVQRTPLTSRNKVTATARPSQSSLASNSSSSSRQRRNIRTRRDQDTDDDDGASVASSTGTAGRRRATSASSSRAAISHVQAGSRAKGKDKHSATGTDQQLRKSASASTTASVKSNTSTEVRAAVSNRASRSALTSLSPKKSLSPGSSPATSFSSWQDPEYGSQRNDLDDFETSPGIIQVNPAPSPTPPLPAQQRARQQMASSILPSFFGRRRPTSSASSVHSSNFAAANPAPPGPGAFDFNSILSSLDSDTAAQADLDAIAEICGRSRLSLANAHANHRGPVGELVAGHEASPGMLETVREGTQDEHRRTGSRTGSSAGDDRWRSDVHGDERERQSPRGALSGVVAYGTTRSEEEGRARRHLMRVRDVSNERERRQRRG